MVQVRYVNVTVDYGETLALHDLCLEIQDGEFFSILGPSGCGKTTALRAVAGFVEPTRGAIYFDGADITRRPPNRRNAAMVFQNYALFPHMNVFDNVAYGLKARKTPRDKIRERVHRALERVHMAEYAKRPVDELSGGQQQRVALARAIVVEPDVLLLDEPLSNLDARLRDSTRDQIIEVQKQVGITALYVTHDREEALAMSDRMVVLEKGKAVQVGAPVEVYRNPATPSVARFVSDANLIDGRIESVSDRSIVCSLWGRHRLDLGPPDNRQAMAGQEVTLAIRPETFHFSREHGGETLTARLTRVKFGGSHVEYEMDLYGNRCHFLEPAGKRLHKVGDEVPIAVNGPDVRFWER